MINSGWNTNEDALIIFIKNPQIGKVKTRIAKGSDDETALRIYKRLLDHTHTITQRVKATKYLFYSDFIEEDQWSEKIYTKALQRGANLGERMLEAFIEALCYHKRVTIIGSDCIYLNSEHISKAFEELKSNDCVIGPSKDGGYYLLGMTSLHKDLFLNIPWSSGKELQKTLDVAQSLSLQVSSLEELNDIDHIEDWEEYLLSSDNR